LTAIGRPLARQADQISNGRTRSRRHAVGRPTPRTIELL